MISIRLPPQVIKAIDAWAKQSSERSRSHAIRALIERGLKGL